MPSSVADFERELATLRSIYLAGLPHKLAELREAYDAWKADPITNTGESVHRRVHAFNGAGATYGFARVSETAHEVELQLVAILKRGTAPSTDEWLALDKLLDALSKVIQSSDGSSLTPPVSGPGRMLGAKWVLLLTSDQRAAASSVEQLKAGGYAARTVTSFDALEQSLPGRKPSLIVLDEAFWNGSDCDDPRLARLVKSGIPCVFLTRECQVRSRLRAIRLGAADVLLQPIDAGAIARLDELLGLDRAQPYRVLVVEDDRALSSYYEAVLEDAGMIVEVVNEPLDLLGPVTSFRPELILLDLRMPTCDGIELCTVLRQMEDLLGTPIVFLSGETSWEKQWAAMSAGADDFLIKPITPERLITAVLHRARRLRRLGGYIGRDSLTRLWNHASFKERLKLEVARAVREQAPMSLAILDLDYFKAVNDTHGHAAGDRVLLTLARTMQDALRQTDTIARVGGEEFGIILPSADETNAVRVLDELRRSFQSTVHDSEFGEFRVTLSCGVASLTPGMDATALTEAADKALYRAKRLGRNRVVTRPAQRASGRSGELLYPVPRRRSSSSRLRGV